MEPGFQLRVLCGSWAPSSKPRAAGSAPSHSAVLGRACPAGREQHHPSHCFAFNEQVILSTVPTETERGNKGIIPAAAGVNVT